MEFENVFERLRESAEKIAEHNVNVLILGETGSGKEYIADLIQRKSERKNKPYIKLNCAAIPETLIESELFGYEKGAFTGATEKRAGKLEMANGGIMLLDEIGDMPIALQSRLLRVTDGQPFTRVGGNAEITVDVRFISATHKNIEMEIKSAHFREDLYYRLAQTTLITPPLRHRKNEIIKLAEEILLLIKAAGEAPETVQGFSEELKVAMIKYDWPGNFRELRNKITHAAIKASPPLIETADMFNKESAVVFADSEWTSFMQDLNYERAARKIILEALNRANWRQKDAAVLLGLSTRRLNYKISQHKIKHHKWPINN